MSMCAKCKSANVPLTVVTSVIIVLTFYIINILNQKTSSILSYAIARLCWHFDEPVNLRISVWKSRFWRSSLHVSVPEFCSWIILLIQKLTVCQFLKNFFFFFLSFIEEQYSLPCSQEPATIPYSETDRSIPHTKKNKTSWKFTLAFTIVYHPSLNLTAIYSLQVQLHVILFRPKRAIITSHSYHSPYFVVIKIIFPESDES